ncbi:MAG: TonB-dependent receptor, partial [Porticoccaceae bacterium]|nr:TonB-dependent receptor [Porticoccaceae bacterium]
MVSITDLRSHSFTGLERSEEKLTWMANLQWDMNDDTMMYATVSTGFKGGGFDEAYSGRGTSMRRVNPRTGEVLPGTVPGVDSSILEYNEEEVLSYEVGAKMSLADGAAELNIALFRSEYEELQVSSLVGDVFRVGNAGEAVTQGIELDGRWLVAEGLTLGGSVAYLDASYDEFKGATCTVPQSFKPAANPGCLDANGQNITTPGQAGG